MSTSSERRSEDRLVASGRAQPYPTNSGLLLNLSQGGFAVEIPQKCRFARGEAHRLSIRVGASRVDLEGTVRWTHSRWGAKEIARGAAYRQVAGFELHEPVSDDTAAILKILRRMMRDSKIRVAASNFRPLKRLRGL